MKEFEEDFEAKHGYKVSRGASLKPLLRRRMTSFCFCDHDIFGTSNFPVEDGISCGGTLQLTGESACLLIWRAWVLFH